MHLAIKAIGKHFIRELCLPNTPLNKQIQVAAFTTRYGRRVLELITDAELFDPSALPNNELDEKKLYKTKALWDTGATHSAITPQTAKELNLVPTGRALVTHAAGETSVLTYLINVVLPNKVIIQGVRVSECSGNTGNFGVLIGMDIISLGDFAVSNNAGKTVLSYSLPSVRDIDFTQGLQNRTPVHVDQKVGRNDKCPCGSGKKYKYCHGIDNR